MNGLDFAVSRLTRAFCLAGGWALLALVGLTVVSSISRKFFNYGIHGVDEYGGYVLAAVAAIGFSHALVERAHIRIEILRGLLRPPLRAVIDIVALLTLTFTALFFASVSIGVLNASIRLGSVASTPLQTPLYVPQAIWAGALVLFAATCVYLMVRCLAALYRRDWNWVCNRLGGESVEEEVSREIESFRSRSGPVEEERA